MVKILIPTYIQPTPLGVFCTPKGVSRTRIRLLGCGYFFGCQVTEMIWGCTFYFCFLVKLLLQKD